jgi:hypothetical protein
MKENGKMLFAPSKGIEWVLYHHTPSVLGCKVMREMLKQLDLALTPGFDPLSLQPNRNGYQIFTGSH